MKVALITGGSRGLGKSMALHLGSQGRDVILTYKSAKGEADTVVRQIEAMGRKAKERAHKHFTIHQMIKSMEDFYEDLCQEAQ